MNTKLVAALLLLVAMASSACSTYTGIAVKDKKVYATINDGSVDVCDQNADGTLSNCRNQ